MGVLTACEDDFGKNGTNSGVLTMKVEVPEGWTSGVAVDEEAPDSRCVSVDAAASESSIPLYLHTIESDNTVAVPSTRGALKESVTNFSMSAICYEEGGVDISELTPNFAYDLTCGVTVGSDGVSTVSCPERLLWPANGRVRFFAFALPKDSPRPFTLSGADASPTITYTVPDKVADQHDLMAACTDATSANVTLNFRHILTAVKVVTAEDMIPGKITEVTFSGIPNMGTYTPAPTSSDASAAQDKWEIVGTSTGTYTVKWEEGVAIGGGYQGSEVNKEANKEDNIVGTGGGQELIGEADNRTLLMIPQKLPKGATLTVTFEEALSKNPYTLSADLGGKEWPAGKILTYSISPSSIHIKPVVEFNKKPGVEEDILPYSGVWHDVKVRAYAEVTKDKEVKKVEEQIPEILYSFDGGNSYSSGHFYDSNGINELKPAASTESSNVGTKSEIADNKVMCVLQAQEDFTTLQGTLNGEFDSNKVIDLYEKSGNESANCYMLDKPGYYKFPVVYGNSYKDSGKNTKAYFKPETTTSGLQYYPDYKGKEITTPFIEDAENAVLAWQDAPDLIDDVKFISGTPSWVQFRVRRYSITQGNALIVARNKDNEIVWSWHIWVSQHTKSWMSGNNDNCKPVKSIYKSGSSYKFTGKEYELADFNLGYCGPHEGNNERNFKIKFKIKVNNSVIEITKYIAGEKTIDTEKEEFKQAEFKGSLAGDNTYYQWGRNAPTPGGIYNAKTPKYEYKGGDYSELNMENKLLFNVYNDGEVSYNLMRNERSTGFATVRDEEKGVTIDWAIQHPYVFIMSQYDENETYNPDKANYRDHWHKPIVADYKPEYAKYAPKPEDTKLFQMWNPKATQVIEDMNSQEDDVAKSVYDPCPAGYLVPPANLFSAFAYTGSYPGHDVYKSNAPDGNSTSVSSSTNYKWIVTATNGNTFEFPATGVRNKSLRYNEFSSVSLVSSTRDDYDPCNLSNQTYPAFRMLTYLSSSTMGTNAQVALFYIDNRQFTNEITGKRDTDKGKNSLNMYGNTAPGIGNYQSSADSYGLSVRPMREKASYDVEVGE